MMLDNFSDEELQNELRKRSEKPKQLAEFDLLLLTETCGEYIDRIASGKYHEDDDIKHYIFECAIETIYGKDVWKWINRMGK